MIKYDENERYYSFETGARIKEYDNLKSVEWISEEIRRLKFILNNSDLVLVGKKLSKENKTIICSLTKLNPFEIAKLKELPVSDRILKIMD